MPFEQTGMEFIAKGAQRFISDLGRMNAALRGYQLTASALKPDVEQLGYSVGKTGKTFHDQRGNFIGAAEAMRRFEENLREVRIEQEELKRAAIQAPIKNLISAIQEGIGRTREYKNAQDELIPSTERVNELFERLLRWQNAIGTQYDIASLKAYAYATALKELQEETEGVEKSTEETTKSVSKVSSIIGGASAFFGKLGTVINVVGGILKAFGSIVKGAIKFVESLVQAILSLVSAVVRLGKALVGGVLGALGKFFGWLQRISEVAIGFLVADIIKSIVRELSEIPKVALEAAARLQTLEIQFEGLLARQARVADSTLTVAQSFEVAAKAAQGYIQWIKEIALAAPFDAQTIVDTFVLGQAFGFTAEQARTLTIAILGFASGMGLTNEQMQRIIFNFGQMKAAGKVTGTELRDLARGSFVPVTQILRKMAEEIGVLDENFQEFLEGAKSGAVDINAFFQSFIDTVGEDFPDAIERMAKTLQGAQTRARNFLQVVIGYEVLGPLMDRLAEKANAFLDAITSPEAILAARKIGIALSLAFDTLYEVVTKKIIPALQALALAFGINIPTVNDLIGIIGGITRVLTLVGEKIAEWINTSARDMARNFTNVASSAYQWGVNLAIQLARGIVDGASTAIVAAMQFINGLLSKWLRGRSPPLVAPKIDIWGGRAFTEWLKGFGLADFGVLKALQSPLRSALSIFVQLGKLTGEKSANLFAGVTKGLAQLLAGGGGSLNSIFEGVVQKLGLMGTELKNLAKLELQLLDITKQLEVAQEALNEAQQNQRRAIAAVGELTQEYNALLRAGADPAILDAKLAEINAAETERENAIAATEAAEEQVAALEGQLDPMQEAVRIQQELLNQMLEMARLQVEMSNNRPSGGGGGGFDPGTFELAGGGFEIPEFESVFDEVAKAFEEGAAKAEEKFNAFVQRISTLIGYARTKFTIEFYQIRQAFGALSETFSDPESVATILVWSNYIIEQVMWVWSLFTSFGAGIQRVVEQVGEVFGKSGEDVNAWVAIWGLAKLAIEIAVGFIVGVIGGLIGAFSFVIGVVTFMVGSLIQSWQNLHDSTIPWWQRISDFIVNLFGTLVTLIATPLIAIIGFIWGFVQGVIGFFESLYSTLVGNSIIPDMVNAILEWFNTLIVDGLANIGQWILDMLALFIPADWIKAGKAIMQGFWDGLKELWSSVAAWVSEKFGWLLDLINSIFNTGSPSRETYKIGMYIGQGLINGMDAMTQGLLGAADRMAGSTKERLFDQLAPVPATVPTTSSTVNMNIGSINSGMDEVYLTAVVQRAIERML